MKSILDRLDGLHTYVGERFDTLESRIDTQFADMDTHIDRLEEDVSFIR